MMNSSPELLGRYVVRRGVRDPGASERIGLTLARAASSPHLIAGLCLRVEREVDQRVVVKVDHVVIVEVPIYPAGAGVDKAVVGARVVVEVDDTIEIGIAVMRVAQKRVAWRDGESADA